MRRTLGRLVLVVAVSLVSFAPLAHAAARLVVLPVTVGGGPEPEAALMSALAEGLRQNPQWSVEQGQTLVNLIKAPAPAMTEEELAPMAAQVEEATQKLGQGAAADAIPVLERAREDLIAAGKKAPRGEKGDDLAWRTSLLLAQALLAANEEERARKIVEETTLLFPGRKRTAADQATPEVVRLLEAGAAGMGGKLTLKTRPEGCEILVGGVVMGKGQVEIAVLPGSTYYAMARCGGAAAASGGPARSFVKKIALGPDETTRQEVLDAEFERNFQAEGQQRLRFASSAERRQVEEGYARRVAERFDADVVVLASVGELSGADWLNARLYLRSGYLNRQGLVRLEGPRANALGRYLATGKETPGVLKPEEASEMVATAQALSQPQSPETDPWYTDAAGWTFLGVGIVSTSLGFWAKSVADRREDDAFEIRNDSLAQMEKQRSAQNADFWGNIGTVTGLIMTGTGAIMLVIPEYKNPNGEMFVLAPAPLRGGGGLSLSGRF